METDYVLRKVEAGDLERICRIANDRLREDYHQDFFIHFYMYLREAFLVVTASNEVVGFILTVPHDRRTMRVLLLAVDGEWANRGIGISLISGAKRYAKARMMSKLRLEVGVDNRTAISFYSKNGFQITGTFDGFYSDGTDAYVMTCYLPA